MPHGGTAVATNYTQQTPVISSGGTGDTNVIWTIWNSQSAVITSATTSAPTNDLIWSTWIQIQGTTGTGSLVLSGSPTTGSITSGAIGNTLIWTSWVEDNNLSQEQLQVRQQQQAEQQAQYRERQIVVEAEAAKARSRAERLLRENLDEKQREELSAKGYFELDVLSQNGPRRRYRIHRKWAGNIQQIDPQSGQRLKTLCIHPREQTPVEDSMLAQKLMLEGGMEEDLLRIANHS